MVPPHDRNAIDLERDRLGTIIYLAALSGVDQEQYEAAIMDGAGRFRRVWHITLPAIRSTIIIMLIMRIGRFCLLGLIRFS